MSKKLIIKNQLINNINQIPLEGKKGRTNEQSKKHLLGFRRKRRHGL